jgi:2-polyprenyl-3-methyl-5-hydroxy-6-metoxy-1,4-benzoquinol methylase
MTIWNERYSSENFLFGKEPNRFFKEKIDGMNPGKILLPAEGEGRNAVYAARMGWEVYAFDASSVGKDKALQLAEQEGVSIHYDIRLIEDFQPVPEEYDSISLIYCHLQPDIRAQFFHKLIESLAPGGTLFLEVFRKEQLGYKSGGPGDPEMLYSAEQLAHDFSGLEELSITLETVWLDEGPGHQGEAKVVRLTGRK